MDKKRDSFFLADNKLKKKNKIEPADNDNFKKNYKEENNSKIKRQENYNKNRPGMISDQEAKKPFDKKTYRLKKYSKKYKLDQYEEQRKKKLLRDYYKDVQNDPMAGSYKPISFDNDDVDGNQEAGRFVRHPDLISKEAVPDTNGAEKPQKKDPFSKAKQRYEKVKQEKADKQKEIEKAKEERQQKLMEYKKKKQERFKKLSKKTRKGQPVMTGRLELLLDKIQSNK